jgi:hypothetical protein
MDPVVTRLHQALVDSVRRTRPGAGLLPITVAEIYQELVPYKSVRAALGVEMNADYEYALLRLLAGEGGFVRLEPAEVRDALRLEIDSPNPNVALYREFAGCDVWLNMETDEFDNDDDLDISSLSIPEPRPAAAKQPKTAAAKKESASRPVAPALADLLNVDIDEELAALLNEPIPVQSREQRTPSFAFPTEEADRDEEEADELADLLDEPEEAPQAAAAPAAAPADAGVHERGDEVVAAATCKFCSQPLPSGRAVNFCPHCGGDQRVMHCATCGEEVEKDWRFCPACGATVANAGSAA